MITIFIITDNVRHWGIIDKPITRRELQEIQWSLNPARIINFALIVEPNENEQIRRFRTNPSCAEYS